MIGLDICVVMIGLVASLVMIVNHSAIYMDDFLLGFFASNVLELDCGR